tara:strand:- start:329 stop:709 length:381 start_codon:yes stop_codon:yes gene_type:complete
MNKKNKLIKGKWWDINNKVKKIITAKYDKIKDWVIDPKGYFLISVDKDLKIIRAAYCVFKELKSDPQHDMIYEIRGYTALEIVNTIIANNLISSLQHAADLGIELHKAEIALKKGLEYIQDKDLKI